MQHDLSGLFPVHSEEMFQDVHDELHRSVVIVQQQHLVKRRALQFGLRALYRDVAIPAFVSRCPYSFFTAYSLVQQPCCYSTPAKFSSGRACLHPLWPRGNRRGTDLNTTRHRWCAIPRWTQDEKHQREAG